MTFQLGESPAFVGLLDDIDRRPPVHLKVDGEELAMVFGPLLGIHQYVIRPERLLRHRLYLQFVYICHDSLLCLHGSSYVPTLLAEAEIFEISGRYGGTCSAWTIWSINGTISYSFFRLSREHGRCRTAT